MKSAALLAGLGFLASYALADGGPAHQVKQTPPVKMGTSGGEIDDSSRFYCCGGTLGSLVVRDGVLCILSNNHILARSGGAPTGDDTIQPGLIDNGCSTANLNIVGDFAGDLVPLGSANVDTALSIARAGMVDTSGSILDIGVPCANIQAPALNMNVMKSGRTTGLTTGQITSLNTSVSVQYQRGCNQGRRFTISYSNQIVTTNMSAGGDSGSLLVSNDGSPNPVGLLYAGSSSATIYNPIQDVVNAYTAGGHTFSFVGGNCLNLGDPVTPAPPAQELDRALAVKVEHENELLKLPGVYGVGIGSAADNPLRAVIIIYADKPGARADLPNQIDRIDVRIIETAPFVAQ